MIEPHLSATGMMKITFLLFCVAAATAAVVQTASADPESDLEGAQTKHHKYYGKMGGVYVGAFPSYPNAYPGGFAGGYPGGYPSAYPYPGYGGNAYG